MTSHPHRFPISVLTGFLGSGKTTVLNYLVQQPEFSRTLVLINEFGKIGLDHNLVMPSVDDAVIEMSSGCLCCTFRADLVKVLKEAPWRFSRNGETWFNRVIIETTGIADPTPILHTLINDSAVIDRYRLDGVVTVVDAVNGAATLDRHLECVKQVAVADRLVLSKTDLVDSQQLKELGARLKALNPSARQVSASEGRVDPDLIFDAGIYNPATKSTDARRWLDAESGVSGDPLNAGSAVSRHDTRIGSSSFTVDQPIEPEALNRWLSDLLRFDAAKLLRIKGILNIAGTAGPTVIHGVQHTFHPPTVLDDWPDSDHRSRIVFITYDIDPSDLRASVDQLTEALPNAPLPTPSKAFTRTSPDISAATQSAR